VGVSTDYKQRPTDIRPVEERYSLFHDLFCVAMSEEMTYDR
jgi:hypothetical protein